MVDSIGRGYFVFWSLSWRIPTGKFLVLNLIALSEKNMSREEEVIVFAGQPNHLNSTVPIPCLEIE